MQVEHMSENNHARNAILNVIKYNLFLLNTSVFSVFNFSFYRQRKEYNCT